MLNDIGTVIWKEWKELVARSSRSRAETLKTIAVGGVIIAILLWRSSVVVSNLAALVVPSFVLIQLLAGIMADSFAGERERHTLETLLASRLSNTAILIGKIVAGVALVWGLILLTIGVSLSAAYIRGDTGITVSLGDVIAIVSFYLLVCCLISCAAVLVSLRASTVRQAIQTLTWSFMILFLLSIFIAARLPIEWRATLSRALAGRHLLRTELTAAAILLALNAILFGAARLRFQRARLILD